MKSLVQEGHIDYMTAKWLSLASFPFRTPATQVRLSLTPNPPRTAIFYTLTKIYKPTPVSRPIIMISVRWLHGADI